MNSSSSSLEYWCIHCVCWDTDTSFLSSTERHPIPLTPLIPLLLLTEQLRRQEAWWMLLETAFSRGSQGKLSPTCLSMLFIKTVHCLPHHFHPCRCCLQPPMTATSAQLPCCPPWVCIVGNASSHAHWPWISLLQEPRPPSVGSITSPNPGWEQLPTSEPTSHWLKMCIHPLSSSKEIHSNPNWTIFPPQLYVVALTPAPMSRLISHILRQRLVPYL